MKGDRREREGQVRQSEEGQDLGSAPHRHRWAILRPGVVLTARVRNRGLVGRPWGATGGFRSEEGFERNCQLSQS